MFRRQPTTPTRTELLYLPYYCFEIELLGSAENQTVNVAVDGLAGDVVFFVTTDLDIATIGGQQICDFEQTADKAREVALDQYKHMLLEHGLRNKTSTTVQNISKAREMLYPFWVAYFQKGDAYDFKAVDGVSGEVQGIRMRKVFLRAFRQLDSD
jgi:predicted small metal-binding protein